MKLKFNGDKLKQLRLDYKHADGKTGMTMEELADEINISQSNISNLETNKKTSPRAGTVEKISKVFKVNPIIFYIDKNTAAELLNMNEKLSEFVTNQNNITYLNMAIQLKDAGITQDLLNSLIVMVGKSKEVREALEKKSQ